MAAAAAAALLLAATAVAAEPVPEGYRMDRYRAPTPETVPGAQTVDTAAVAALVETGAARPVNVMKADRSALPGGPWLVAEPRPQIPGGVWLPNVGLGALSAEEEAGFAAALERLTGGRRDGGLLFYCLADCWMSWNAAKRAAALGYTRVFWYREGLDGWEAAGRPTEPGLPVPP